MPHASIVFCKIKIQVYVRLCVYIPTSNLFYTSEQYRSGKCIRKQQWAALAQGCSIKSRFDDPTIAYIVSRDFLQTKCNVLK